MLTVFKSNFPLHDKFWLYTLSPLLDEKYSRQEKKKPQSFSLCMFLCISLSAVMTLHSFLMSCERRKLSVTSHHQHSISREQSKFYLNFLLNFLFHLATNWSYGWSRFSTAVQVHPPHPPPPYQPPQYAMHTSMATYGIKQPQQTIHLLQNNTREVSESKIML